MTHFLFRIPQRDPLFRKDTMRPIIHMAIVFAMVSLLGGCDRSGQDVVEKHDPIELAGVGEEELVIELQDGITLAMIQIPASAFIIGEPESDPDRLYTGLPRRGLEVPRPFYLGKYPVTQEQWQAIMGYNRSDFVGAKNPVESVSWLECQKFVEMLNERVADQRVQFRLPTEAEWECACRAGTTTRYSFGDDPEQLGDYAWYADNSGGRTHPVGQKKPNLWGFYDMHGNVWEWCADGWDATLGEQLPLQEPSGRLPGAQRVYRGGGWAYFAPSCRSASRSFRAAFASYNVLGFRVALTEKPSQARNGD